ncbi:MAG: DUF4411 family protein [Gemmataceae bacterium]|nr:DUF4411 family protein [Gemmataceae bacterium]
MSRKLPFYLDSDVFIAAKNTYYAFSICPGFWECLIHHHRAGRVFSIDQVQRELLLGRETEDLVQWVKNDLPAGFFLQTNDKEVKDAYEEIMLWVQRNPQYEDAAKAKFATEADGWLVAYARVHLGIVVTNEQPRPNSKSRILLPDVCAQFGVKYHNTFVMLKELKARFDWKEEAHARRSS